MRTLITPLVCILAGSLAAQDMSFMPSPSQAMAHYTAKGENRYGTCVNVSGDDTTYTYNEAADSLEMIMEKRPLMRWEYYADGSLYRQIEIQTKGETDIPTGNYYEHFPSGVLHFTGRVNGSDSRGLLIKTGVWTELNETGAIVHQETFP